MFTKRQKCVLRLCAAFVILFCFGFAAYMVGSFIMRRPIPEIVQGVFSPFYNWVEIVLGAVMLSAAVCFRNARKLWPICVLLVLIGLVNIIAGVYQLIYHPFDTVFEEFMYVQTFG
ncbi:MAG: hypothetical protein IJ112_02890 [Oscillospiraceae bacterium]|nr:hypothetical protein [Oscillospiraceae bacterium]